MNLPVDEIFRSGFEETMTLYPGTAGETTIKVLFDNAFQLQRLPNLEYEGYAPAATCRTSDVESVDQEDAVQIRGVDYLVSSNQPDGTGLSYLILKES